MESELLVMRQAMQREKDRSAEREHLLNEKIDGLKAEIVALRSLHRSETMNANMRESMVLLGRSNSTVVYPASPQQTVQKPLPLSLSSADQSTRVSWEAQEDLRKREGRGMVVVGDGGNRAGNPLGKTRPPEEETSPPLDAEVNNVVSHLPSFTARTLGDRSVSRGDLLARAKQFTNSLRSQAGK